LVFLKLKCSDKHILCSKKNYKVQTGKLLELPLLEEKYPSTTFKNYDKMVVFHG
jgi:hypothetical protein